MSVTPQTVEFVAVTKLTATAAGFTVTSTVNGVPAHPLFAVGVTVYRTTPANFVVLVNVCAMGPAAPVV